MDTEIYHLAKKLGRFLKKKKLFLATAESCTGGELAAKITDVPGSSAYFLGGFVTYSNETKIKILGVKRRTIKKVGAVSEETAQEMALGVLHCTRANLALAITGIAGPTGGTKNKPQGMVCFALNYKGASVKTVTKYFKGSRSAVRKQAVSFALQMILDVE